MLLKKGAEAEIHLSSYLRRKVIIKKRVKKNYRNNFIDNKLRKERTREEARLIAESKKFGISSPIIYDIDLKNYEITMEFIDGKRVKDFLNQISEKQREEICKKIGRSIARLHKANIVHGDLTTSNLILRSGRIYFIDFGLGCKSIEIEDKGVDLHVLMEAFKSTHSEIENSFEYVLNGYKEEYENANEVIEKMEEIVRRGRYAER